MANRLSLMLFRPTLGDGGADRVTLTLLQHLDPARYSITLVLVQRKGELLPLVPTHVEVVDLGVARLALATLPLARLIRARNPEVVFCTAGGANVVCSAAHRLANSRSRLVLSERSALERTDRSALRSKPELLLKQRLYRRAAVVTAVSDGVAAELRAVLGLPAEKIATVYNPVIGPDCESLCQQVVSHPWFAPSERSKATLLVACGRLVAIKDYHTMLLGVAALTKQLAVRLVVLGEGKQKSELVEQARTLGLSDSVDFIGFDPNPYKYFAKADAVVQTSRAEGLPGVLIQAQASGAPVIATDCDHGPREVVAHGTTGLLVPVGEPQVFADAVATVLRDRDLASRLASQAKASAQRYSLQASLARYEQAIRGQA